METFRLLVLSHVLPFPGSAGQQQRVYYTLKALRKSFHVTFLAPVDADRTQEVREKLSALSDEAILLPSRYSHSKPEKVWRRIAGAIYTLRTGLKLSNYVIGQLEFAPLRVASLLNSENFDCALFEYWHAAESVSAFHEKGISCVLDMHNILWQSYTRQLAARPGLPGWWKRWAVAQYKTREEQAWKQFDGLIAINAGEAKYARSVVSDNLPIFYAPMGTDLELWPYAPEPAQPPRIAYYGSLGNPHNQQDALNCYKHIMPNIWQEFPRAELWLVGSSPPVSIQSLAKDKRVHVTGYVECVQEILKTMSLVVCPWSGTYGFRSRLIEVMALGVPVVVSPQAVYGMGMDIERGVFLAETFRDMAEACLNLIRDAEFAGQQSQLARNQVEEKFGYEVTYGRLAKDLLEFFCQQKRKRKISLSPPILQ